MTGRQKGVDMKVSELARLLPDADVLMVKLPTGTIVDLRSAGPSNYNSSGEYHNPREARNHNPTVDSQCGPPYDLLGG